MQKRCEDSIEIDNFQVVTVPEERERIDVDTDAERIRILRGMINDLFRERNICSHEVELRQKLEGVLSLEAKIDRPWSDAEWQVMVNELNHHLEARYPHTDLRARREHF